MSDLEPPLSLVEQAFLVRLARLLAQKGIGMSFERVGAGFALYAHRAYSPTAVAMIGAVESDTFCESLLGRTMIIHDVADLMRKRLRRSA